MASVSSTSSLGNTSLRGFGGMASGIDRDAIIEKMTLGTTTKISNRKKEVTKLQWKQEAYRNLSDKIIDISDKYASYTSTSNLKDPSAFAKNIITAMGREEATRFVKATGSSRLIDNISIKEVSQLATSTVLQSQKHINDSGIQTSLNGLTGRITPTSTLEGSILRLGLKDTDGRWSKYVDFTFPSSYTIKGGNSDGSDRTVNISYVPQDGETDEAFAQRLTNDLNAALAENEQEIDGKKLNQLFSFGYADGKVKIVPTDAGKGIYVNTASPTLSNLGYEISGKEPVLLSELGDPTNKFADSALRRPETIDYLTNKKLTFDYNGTKKEITLLTKDEADYLKNLENYKELGVKEGKTYVVDDGNGKLTLTEDGKRRQLQDLADLIQGRLNKAFGENAVVADASSGSLSFKTGSSSGESSSVSIISNDTELLQNLGIAYGESNKVNTGGRLNQSALKIDASDYMLDGELDLVINGERIHGLKEDSTIDEILSKINSTPGAGVKATYVDATGQFMLVSSETGAGRNIELNSDLAKKLFGTGEDDPNLADNKKGQKVDGKNAKIKVSYGNGVDIDLERSSNTFNLEGLDIAVSGVFSETVTFSAKADVDGVVEKVKSFFEDFNALVADINGQVRTRPDSSYGPLTDEQKDEMDETSIENWENKAKQGILYGDSIIRDLSGDVEGIFTKLLSNGASYEDLKKIGITYSEDWGDGGTLVFDEAAFRSAMETDPEKVSNIFTGGGEVKKGLISIVEDTFTPYATRYASRNSNGNPGSGSYGRLIEMAGSEKKPTTLFKNEIYKQIEEMNKMIDKLQDQLKVEQDRYISQFTTMETLLNQMNTQSSYLSQLNG